MWSLAGGGPFGLSLGKITKFANDMFYSPIRHRLVAMIFTPAFFGVLGLTLLLERMIPARSTQK